MSNPINNNKINLFKWIKIIHISKISNSKYYYNNHKDKYNSNNNKYNHFLWKSILNDRKILLMKKLMNKIYILKKIKIKIKKKHLIKILVLKLISKTIQKMI